MKKLVNGIIDFRRIILPNYRSTFAQLALGQKPDALFVSCSDSRVAVNLFASTDPGDLFVVRNVGNMIPTCNDKGIATTDQSAAAAVEFALGTLNVSNVIVCGHSECGAMLALMNGREKVASPNLRNWLRYGEESLKRLDSDQVLTADLAVHNKLSQLNVLLQLEHLKSYPTVKERLAAGTLGLHGWWFELSRADVYNYNFINKQFVIFDEVEASKVLADLKERQK